MSVAVDLEPDGRAALVGIDRPSIGERVEEQQVVLVNVGLRFRTNQLVGSA